jgi:hypothetical protein
MKPSCLFLLPFVILAFLGGCAGAYISDDMRKVEADKVYAPEPGRALVIFMRPSSFGYAIQSVVYDASAPENELIGIVSATTRVAYSSPPGERLFMVVSEAADFLKADLEAGKTYYALVTPRMGAWRARFSLRPVRQKELDSSTFKGWWKGTRIMENTDASRQWAVDNKPSVDGKRADYLLKFNAKSPEELEEVTLHRDDGR